MVILAAVSQYHLEEKHECNFRCSPLVTFATSVLRFSRAVLAPSVHTIVVWSFFLSTH